MGKIPQKRAAVALQRSNAYAEGALRMAPSIVFEKDGGCDDAEQGLDCELWQEPDPKPRQFEHYMASNDTKFGAAAIIGLYFRAVAKRNGALRRRKKRD